MKLSDGVEWGVHACTILAVIPPPGALPAAKLAEYHGVPAAYMAKHLQALARAGILETVKGPRGGYRLAKAPNDISVLDIVEAIEGDEPAFRCSEIRRRGPAALPARHYSATCAINSAFLDADEAWRAELRNVSVGQLVVTVVTHAPAAGVEKTAAWLQDALR
jgi:Rrf2 family protein